MGWKDIFGKKKNELDPLKDLTLKNMKPGYYVDYDMKTWQVTAYNHYDWGDREYTYEWQLKTADDIIYLEREPDDEDYWCICRRISINRLGPPGIRDYILEHEDPPDEIVYENTTYYLEQSGGGQFLKDGKGEGKKLLKWDYEDDSGSRLVSIEQWGEEDFEASAGTAVEEYQFTNILPSEKTIT